MRESFKYQNLINTYKGLIYVSKLLQYISLTIALYHNISAQ